jgi:hypothetical protein
MLKCIFRSVQAIAMKESTYDVDIEEIDEEEEEEEEEELELKDKLICDLHNVHIL